MDLQIHDGCDNLWSDILHFYWLAEKTKDIWDYSTYTRSIRINGCIIIEKKLADFSGCKDVGYSIRNKIDKHNTDCDFKKIIWDSGWGKKYSELLAKRKKDVHSKENDVKKHEKIKSHLKILTDIVEILEGIHNHYQSKERRFWTENQYEELKTTCMRAFLSSINHAFPEDRRCDIGFFIEGKKVYYSTVPERILTQNYNEMKTNMRGPVTETFVEINGNPITTEKWFSRGC